MANKIKKLRKSQNMTTQELSMMTGIARSTLGSYETRGLNPNAEKAQILADFFDVDIDYLLGKQEEKRTITSLQDFISDLENNIENEEQNHDRFIRFFKALSVSFTEADFTNLTDIISGYSLLTKADRFFFTDVIGMRSGILNESFTVKEGNIFIIPNEEE